MFTNTISSTETNRRENIRLAYRMAYRYERIMARGIPEGSPCTIRDFEMPMKHIARWFPQVVKAASNSWYAKSDPLATRLMRPIDIYEGKGE